jgi:hypothetical protein
VANEQDAVSIGEHALDAVDLGTGDEPVHAQQAMGDSIPDPAG